VIGPVIDEVRMMRPRPLAGLHREDVALDVGGEDRVEVGLRHVVELRVGEDTCVGTQDVDAAERCDCLVRDPLAVLDLRHVGDHRGHCARLVLASQLVGSGREGRLVAGGDQEARALAGEHPGDALADSLATAGHDDRAPLQ
jgi:hypothetical protein